jgi:two-component system, chemotaxis family, sensor histidine kinase and response regulator WspE
MDNKKILVVEDDLFLREIYVEVLKNSGYIIDYAVDGEEGLEKIKLGGWDLVLLDIVMPKLSGVDVIFKLRQDPNFQVNKYYKKLVFLTNLDNDHEIKEALQYSDGYLIKSKFNPGQMLEEVKHYLG